MSIIKTHSNFKSLDPSIRDATDIERKGHIALLFQYRYKKRTTPVEFLTWDYQNLEINLELVDRLYYIKSGKIYYGLFRNHFEMVGRMQQFDEKSFIYFALTTTVDEKLTAKNNIRNWDQIQGSIYYSQNPYLFMKVILKNCTFLNKDIIYNSLKQDGKINNDNTPTLLQNLCYETIYQNKDIFKRSNYTSLLPKSVVEKIDKYIQMRRESFLKFRLSLTIYFWKLKES